jgi:hypothetical protein
MPTADMQTADMQTADMQTADMQTEDMQTHMTIEDFLFPSIPYGAPFIFFFVRPGKEL